MRRVMMTTYIAWWRRRWNGEYPAKVLPELTATGTEWPTASTTELRQDVFKALAQLPRGQRAVVVLRYFEDLSEAQAAEALGCSVGTVKSQCARALAALRRSPALASEEVRDA